MELMVRDWIWAAPLENGEWYPELSERSIVISKKLSCLITKESLILITWANPLESENIAFSCVLSKEAPRMILSVLTRWNIVKLFLTMTRFDFFTEIVVVVTSGAIVIVVVVIGNEVEVIIVVVVEDTVPMVGTEEVEISVELNVMSR